MPGFACAVAADPASQKDTPSFVDEWKSNGDVAADLWRPPFSDTNLPLPELQARLAFLDPNQLAAQKARYENKNPRTARDYWVLDKIDQAEKALERELQLWRMAKNPQKTADINTRRTDITRRLASAQVQWNIFLASLLINNRSLSFYTTLSIFPELDNVRSLVAAQYLLSESPTISDGNGPHSTTTADAADANNLPATITAQVFVTEPGPAKLI